ncbi:RNA polymerase sigma factor [Streptomyces sp. NPDC090077]|uniref:RNA polymerase sigma factor n=1 Tax=Streptomyces sp. NPDC090077 TaxID=3365938 RepID=UPI0037FBB3F8
MTAGEAAQGPRPDPTAFEDEVVAMYRAKGPVLVRYAQQCLNHRRVPASRVSAEDVVQDAIVIALVNHARTPIDDLPAYVCAVIANQVRDEARRKGVTHPLDTAGASETTGPRTVLWAYPAQDVDGRLDVERALRQMSPQQRRLLLLSKGVGFSHEELARANRLHRGTIARHVSRATRALLAALGPTFATVFLVMAAYAAGGTDEDPGSPAGGNGNLPELPPGTLPVVVVVLAALLLLVVVVQRQVKTSGLTLRAARQDLVLGALLRVQDEVRARTGKDFPDAGDYARHLRVGKDWIDEQVLRQGHVPQPELDGCEDGLVPLRIMLKPALRVTGLRPRSGSANQVVRDCRRPPGTPLR